MKRTRNVYSAWYPANVNPTRPGVYQIGPEARFFGEPCAIYRYWDGQHWHWTPNTDVYKTPRAIINAAPHETNLIPVTKKEDWRHEWRGLTEAEYMMQVTGRLT